MKISVIIPVYNAEKTIKKCLNSVIEQSYQNLEIICVNDGSTDKSLDIIKTYKNITIINNKKNKGIGYSRNIGIKKATGDYISFIDSDDYIDKDMYKILSNMLKNNEDLIIFNYKRIKNNILTDNEYKFVNQNTTLADSPNIILDINLSPWNKLYKRELLENIFFPEDLKYEDAIFVTKAYNNAKSIKIIDNKLYNYVIGDKGETSRVDKRVFDILKISKLMLDELSEIKNNEYIEAFMVRNLFRYTLQQKRQIDKKIKYRFIDEVFSFLDQNFPNWRKNKIYNKRNLLKRTIEKNKILTKLYVTL